MSTYNFPTSPHQSLIDIFRIIDLSNLSSIQKSKFKNVLQAALTVHNRNTGAGFDIDDQDDSSCEGIHAKNW